MLKEDQWCVCVCVWGGGGGREGDGVGEAKTDEGGVVVKLSQRRKGLVLAPVAPPPPIDPPAPIIPPAPPGPPKIS